MASIEKIKRAGKTYYYVSKNFRIGSNKWKKIRVYTGKVPPSNEDVAKMTSEIEERAKKAGLLKLQQKYRYLSEQEAEVIEDIKEQFNTFMEKLPKVAKGKYIEDFLIRFTYNTNAIEGNRLSLRDTHLILQENIIPQDATTYEYNEVINSSKCMEFMRKYKGELNKSFLLKVHKILTVNTAVDLSGVYRNHNVIITGSSHLPPDFKKLDKLMNGFFVWYNNYKRKLHPLELACLAHTKFTRIHPFSDGNGRTTRIISNFILYKHGYPMFFVDVKERKRYYNSLDESDRGNERVFVKFVFDNVVNQLKSKI